MTSEYIDSKMNTIIHADCLEVMKQIPDDYFDLCLTDPPYNTTKSTKGIILMTKEQQLHKVKRVNLKRMSNIEKRLFHDSIRDNSNGVCQLCEVNRGDDMHHPKFGKFGSDKDDTCQVLVCRSCHDECHKNKHGMMNKIAIKFGDQNYKVYHV